MSGSVQTTRRSAPPQLKGGERKGAERACQGSVPARTSSCRGSPGLPRSSPSAGRGGLRAHAVSRALSLTARAAKRTSRKAARALRECAVSAGRKPLHKLRAAKNACHGESLGARVLAGGPTHAAPPPLRSPLARHPVHLAWPAVRTGYKLLVLLVLLSHAELLTCHYGSHAPDGVCHADPEVPGMLSLCAKERMCEALLAANA